MLTESVPFEVAQQVDVQRGRWDVKALASDQFAHQFYVQIEHYEPERGGWVRYLFGSATSGIHYFPTLAKAREAACTFLAAPSLTACLTS